jgi:hypothetical protein
MTAIHHLSWSVTTLIDDPLSAVRKSWALAGGQMKVAEKEG